MPVAAQEGIEIRHTYSKNWPICSGRRELLPQCVTDGDSFRHNWTNYRVNDIDTPERSSTRECERLLAQEARKKLIEILHHANDLVLITKLDNLNGRELLDKYGRVLVRLEADGASVATIMINAGLARPYKGDTKDPTPWC
jgi:endonuclease YncB( thermonuclease family)